MVKTQRKGAKAQGRREGGEIAWMGFLVDDPLRLWRL